TGLIEAPIHDLLNTVSDTPFEFSVDAREGLAPAKYVKERNRVVLKNRQGDFREFVINELDDSDDIDGPITTATCIPAWQYELQKNIIEDKRYTDKPVKLALDDALKGTRFVGEVDVEL